MSEVARLYDVRYSRYAGDREPRWRGVLALARSSTTRALGIRRTRGAKVWPFLLIAAAHLPAVGALSIPLLVDGAPPALELIPYLDLLTIVLPVVIAFAATTLPSLLTRERRDRVLSLYFSTALSPREYVAGKVLAAVALMSLVVLSPLLVLLVGSVLTADEPLALLRERGDELLPVLGGGLLMAGYFAALGLLAGALTAKRLFAVGGLLAVLLVTPVVAALVAELGDRPDVLAADLSLAPLRAADALLPGEPFGGSAPRPADGLVRVVVGGVLLLSGAVLAARYREGSDA